ncbi:DNA-binding response regulator [Flavobacterium suaedae]|uniref:DNA-binding response regulator n=1 Tax=Flavobacterium suaedae TaxID=1767027 RepID=A0ABQ1JXV3_9FLAO|nr:response regulator transcription factor [Flavobacterium suaedae]GGB78840.1 DNA-binding response regulator [Flavobacterium suaedae]
MFGKHKILLADDHSVVRRGVALILKESLSDIEIHHAADFPGVISKLKTTEIDLLVLDINLPGGNTVLMVERVKAIQPSLKVLIFSAFDEEQFALRYIHAGADGYLNKLSAEEKITEAAITILEGEKYISEKVKNKIFENTLNNTPHNPLETLSDREMEVAALLANGDGNLEIANKLNIQMSTVSTYKHRIFEKLNVNNLVSLVEKYKLYSE